MATVPTKQRLLKLEGEMSNGYPFKGAFMFLFFSASDLFATVAHVLYVPYDIYGHTLHVAPT